MDISSDWRADKAIVGIGATTIVATIAAPFLANAAAELPTWANVLIGAGVFFVGTATVMWRLRRLGQIPSDSPGGTADQPVAAQESSIPDTAEAEDVRRWEVVVDSIRKAPIVAGEGPVLSMGYAQVDAAGDNANKKLYFCKMYDTRKAHAYFEFRVNAPGGTLLKRESEMRLLPGEIVVSKRSWSLQDGGEAHNNIVGDWKSIKDEARELIEGSERMVVVWTDTISYGKDTVETKTHRLVVPLDGFLDAEDGIGRWRRELTMLRYSPF